MGPNGRPFSEEGVEHVYNFKATEANFKYVSEMCEIVFLTQLNWGGSRGVRGVRSNPLN